MFNLESDSHVRWVSQFLVVDFFVSSLCGLSYIYIKLTFFSTYVSVFMCLRVYVRVFDVCKGVRINIHIMSVLLCLRAILQVCAKNNMTELFLHS